MASIKANTTKMIDCGTDIVKKANECSVILDEVFDKLVNINSFAWSGDTAKKYAANTIAKKTEYKRLVQSLANYGNVMKNLGIKLEDIIRKM